MEFALKPALLRAPWESLRARARLRWVLQEDQRLDHRPPPGLPARALGTRIDGKLLPDATAEVSRLFVLVGGTDGQGYQMQRLFTV